MTLEQAIHDLWANSTEPEFIALRQLLAASRVCTGTWKADEDLPYATLNREAGSPLFRSSCGRVDSTLIRLQIWHDNYALGSAIKKASVDAFDDLGLDCDELSIISMRLAGDLNLEEDDGTWQFLLDFQVNNNS